MELIPYAASSRWYAGWLNHRLDGMSESDAVRAASAFINPKELRRATIAGAGEPSLLSVAVAKGPDLLLSSHGNWPRVHLGALNARYGRCPFYPFLVADLAPVYTDPGSSLAEFNGRIHQAVCRWLPLDAARMALELRETDPARFATVRAAALETKTLLNLNISIFDAIFRFGKRSLIGLLPLD